MRGATFPPSEANEPTVTVKGTRTNQALLLGKGMPFPPGSAVSAKALVKGIEGEYIPIPYTGAQTCVRTGDRRTRPVDKVDLLLSNDLVGSKVLASSVTSEKLREVKEKEQLEEKVPGIFADYVATWSLARQGLSEDAEVARQMDVPTA
ncbi:hypothetical protein scyTo_0021864 [Scyliorhinus torazame]|uniref:Uncharacterized protein n=1 Tax=Scyliorhinus torazame TaxID=75743 RepID=A0A401Q8C3_SCYTO|nr:hypothetical protein [Scyliorhinus torazame]